MVYVVEVNGSRYYACVFCGLLYETENLALKCEEFCKNHPGCCDVELAKQSVGYIDLAEEVQKVYFKIDPLRRCGRHIFRICRAEVNIYRAC